MADKTQGNWKDALEHPSLFEATVINDPTEIDPNKFLINDGRVVEGTTFAFNVVPWFPFTINIAPDVRITLTADGKWEGSIEALRAAMATSSSTLIDGTYRILMWLLLREMERDRRFW